MKPSKTLSNILHRYFHKQFWNILTDIKTRPDCATVRKHTATQPSLGAGGNYYKKLFKYLVSLKKKKKSLLIPRKETKREMPWYSKKEAGHHFGNDIV